MKLKTHMSSCTGTPVPSVEWGSNLNASLGHDAMAAHALLQAMEEVNVHEYVFVANALIEVHRRADEILAGWMGEE
jgi:hypothetical protein